MDKYTCIDSICYDDCFHLGNSIINEAKENMAAVAVRIYVDDFMVYQYFMDGTSSGNIPWLEGKRKTTLKTGYSSAYVMKSLEQKDTFALLKEDKELKIYGGAYPLYLDNSLKVIICVSGMTDSLDDHQLIVNVVQAYFK